MKTTFTRIIFSLFLLLIMGYSFAQAPQAFNYQAVARDVSGNVLPAQALGIRISLHMASATGPVVYSETHSPTTNQFGLFTLAIGTGTLVDGQFDTIAWSKNQYWLQVEMDPTGGVTYTDMGTNQLLSVPYAMYAENSVWERNPVGIHYKGGLAGIGTDTPEKILHLYNDDTPCIRLQQSGLSWPTYTWDVAGNESGFFVRDFTGSNSLPFRILPGSGANTLVLSSGNVGIGTTSPTQKLQVAGTVKVDGTVIPGNYTNSALPIAYGFVESAGTLAVGTSNISNVAWNSTQSRYEITITGENYIYHDYVTIVSVCGAGQITVETSSVGGKLLVFLYNSAGTKVQGMFQFVTYKP